MNKTTTLAALVAAAMLSVAGAASAQIAVKGGGASLPAKLYKGETTSILPGNFSYAVTGSGTGKKAFLENNASLFGTTGTVHFAGSDSVLSASELSTYTANYNSATSAQKYGPLIQIPSVATAVTLPFRKSGVSLNLSKEQVCRIFAGTATDWSQISSASGPITVIIRDGSSGTSELLSRFLTSACNSMPAAVRGSGVLVNNVFTTTSTFSSLYAVRPAHIQIAPAVTDNASQDLYDHVMAAEGRIGYVGPDVIPNLSDDTLVAKINSFLPNDPGVQATLNTILPPTGTAANDPANWVPVFGNPSTGYPIAGYTNFVLGQCYKSAPVKTQLQNFLVNHYTGGNDTSIALHGFIPLSATWRDAIKARFLTSTDPTVPSNPASLNYAGTCGTDGRP